MAAFSATPPQVPPAVLVLAAAMVLDLTVAEFPRRLHPVALFGRLVGRADREWAHPRAVGVAVAVGFPLLFAGVLALVVAAGRRVDPLLGGGLAALALFATLSFRRLLAVGAEVITLTTADVDAARDRIVALVGRETAPLSAAELRSGAVESLAENLAEGLVAQLVGFVIGAQVSLAAGVAGAAWVKGVNTLDSMLGYHGKPVGWASARLDDATMWLPARLSSALLALAARDPGALRRARAWADDPRSPNAGWPMATLAAILEVELRKPGAYRLNPSAQLPSSAAADRGARLVGVAGILAVLGAAAVAWASTEPPLWTTPGVIPWS